MIRVPDAASLAAMRHLRAGHRPAGGRVDRHQPVGRLRSWSPRCGPPGAPGSMVTLICDGGERYAHTYYDDDWVRRAGHGPGPVHRDARAFAATGEWAPPAA